MNKDVIYFITKEINKLYDYLAKNGLEIGEKDKNKLIYNLKQLIKQERLARLNELINKYANENNQKYLDRIVDVLIEGPSD